MIHIVKLPKIMIQWTSGKPLAGETGSVGAHEELKQDKREEHGETRRLGKDAVAK